VIDNLFVSDKITALNDGSLSDADLIPTDLLAKYAKGLTQFIK